MAKQHIQIWEALHQNKTTIIDYTGRTLKKDWYGNSKSEFGWVVEEINPSRESDIDNLHIVSIYANAVRDRRVSFVIDGNSYQIRKVFGTPTFQIVKITQEKEVDIWQLIFGESKTAKDFCGREIRKSDKGKKQSQFGWDVDHIMPLSNGDSNTQSNKQIANIQSNAEKADKITFKANGKTYQVRRNKGNLKNENYDYTGCDYCVVEIQEQQPKQLSKQDVWKQEFGNRNVAQDYDEVKIHFDKPDGWVVELLLPDGKTTLENAHIVSAKVHEVRNGRPDYWIYDSKNACTCYYRLRKNTGELRKEQMSNVYDYSEKEYYIERYEIVQDDDDDYDD